MFAEKSQLQERIRLIQFIFHLVFPLKKEMKMLPQFRKAGAHEHLGHVQDENLKHSSVMHITLCC